MEELVRENEELREEVERRRKEVEELVRKGEGQWRGRSEETLYERMSYQELGRGVEGGRGWAGQVRGRGRAGGQPGGRTGDKNMMENFKKNILEISLS